MMKTASAPERDVTALPPGPAPRHAADNNMAAPDRVGDRNRPGQVERTIKKMGVTDIGLIVQAAAIDRASRNLLDRVAAPDGENRGQPRQPITSNRNPAALAATDVPIAVRSASEVRCSDNSLATEWPRPSTSVATSHVGKTVQHRTSRST
jgi:hypothetical protein